MKKTIITAAVVLLAILVATLFLGAGKQSRKLDADYELSFAGRTAICQATVTGERADDFIQVTMRLKQENVIWKTWYEEGYFQVKMEGFCKELIKNKIYTLEISATINGEPQEVLMVRKACTGVVPTEPTTQPTVPTAPTTPATQPVVPPTTQPTTPQLAYPAITPSSPAPNYSTGYGHIHYADADRYWKEYDLFDCVVGQLYWMDKKTHTITLLLAEQVKIKCDEGPYIYLVKREEPTKIYRLLIADPSRIELVVDSAYGEINDISFYPGVKNYLQYTAGNNKFVVYEMNTCEETVLMEQPCIKFGNIGGKSEGVLSDWVWFHGSIPENETYIGYYSYNRVTGEIVEDEDCDD